MVDTSNLNDSDLRTILVVDDHAQARRSVVDTLNSFGYSAVGCESAREALRRLEKESFELVVTDLMMPGMDGIQFLGEMRRRGIETTTVMITAHGSVAHAVQAMRAGAFDFLEKPFDVEQLEGIVRRALQDQRRSGSRSEIPDPQLNRLVGDSPAMQRLREKIQRIAESDATVLIHGESGTGKELVAREIHLLGPRRQHALVSLNCPALSPQLMESELFGHEQGAFTNAVKPRIGRFELADRGTIFLDEVTEIESSLQAKLLRVLQERTFERVGSSRTRSVDVRVIAATNRDLGREVREGRFREDLYFRLAVLPLAVPPLRERREDIALLTGHFLTETSRRTGRPRLHLDDEAVALLERYSWPGNVRELENWMTRAAVLAGGDRITAEELREWGFPPLMSSETSVSFSRVATTAPEIVQWRRSLGTLPEQESVGAIEAVEGMEVPQSRPLEALERMTVEAALARHQGHRERTAKALGIGVRTLSNKLRAWGYAPGEASFRSRSGRRSGA